MFDKLYLDERFKQRSSVCYSGGLQVSIFEAESDRLMC